jgi:magnesium transporter
MQKDPVSVQANDSTEEVVEIISKYDLVSLPVIDSIGRLLGHITVDDVIDEVKEQHERDYQLASGILQDVETSDNIFVQMTARLPWLLLGMIGGLSNSVILGSFETGFIANPKMALFIPLIGGTGGNVGVQSSAIVVQGLANNSLKHYQLVKQVLKESTVALVNAAIISLIVFIYNYFTLGEYNITLSVSISLFAVVMFASAFGTLVPLILDKLKINPALATGPFISITNDIIGMLIYMTTVSLLMG